MNTMNISINVITLIFYLFLVGIFLSKKNMETYENKLYKMLLLWNGVDLIIHLLFLIFAGLKREGLFLKLVSAFHCTALLLCMFFLSFYLIYVSLEKNKTFITFFNNNKKMIHLSLTIFWILFSIIALFIPLYPTYDSNGILLGASGPITTFLTIGLVAMTIFSFTFVLKNRKVADKKKIMPIYLVVILVIVSFSLMVVLPEICIAVVMVTLLSFVMYHTIENPDMKMVAELQLAKNAAEKANNAKSDFLSSMSHEIKTPLNAIVGISEMIKNANSLEEVNQDADDMIIASQNLLDLVNGILDINSLEENKMEIIEEKYKPEELFNDITKLMRYRLGSKNIELRTGFSPSIPNELIGDSKKVKQIINNLISNAIKYTEAGHIDFIVDCINDRDKTTLKIIIKDTGRGISEDQKQYLFTKFYRLDSDKDSDIGGMGLGLAITKSLVELMDGRISCDSTYGEGSTFTVFIPQKLVTSIELETVNSFEVL